MRLGYLLLVALGCFVFASLVGGLIDLHDGSAAALLFFLPIGFILALTDWTVIQPRPGGDALATPSHCAGCRYALTGLGERGTCPECGSSFEPLPAKPTPMRIVGTWNLNRVPGLTVAVLLPAAICPWAATAGLFLQYARHEPWAAAWHNATYRSWPPSELIALAVSFVPMGVLAATARPWLPRWSFPITVAFGMLIGWWFLMTDSHQDLALLQAWPRESSATAMATGTSCFAVAFAAAVLYAVGAVYKLASAANRRES